MDTLSLTVLDCRYSAALEENARALLPSAPCNRSCCSMQMIEILISNLHRLTFYLPTEERCVTAFEGAADCGGGRSRFFRIHSLPLRVEQADGG